jgi:hypothetical protein
LVLEFCHRLREEKLQILFRINTRVNLVTEELLLALKNAGCIKVSYGVESGSDQVLKALGKGFTRDDVKIALALHHKVNLPAAMLMIIGNPLETEETIEESLRLVRECNPNGGADFQIMQPHPGTALGDRLHVKYGEIISYDWDDYFSDNITFIPNGFTKQRFLSLCRKVTGRPVQLAGHYQKKQLASAESKSDVLISPEDFKHGNFDVLGPHWWAGDETYKEGLAHLLGHRHGFVEYEFDLGKLTEKSLNLLSVSARVSSHVPRKTGLVKLLVNNIVLGELTTPEKSAAGHLLHLVHRGSPVTHFKLQPTGNILRFEIAENSSSTGLCIFGHALSTNAQAIAHEIRISLRQESKLQFVTERFRGLFRRVQRLINHLPFIQKGKR